MEGAALLGNDVVDLDDPRCRDKARDRRFLQRVFTPEERGAIEESPDPDRALWIRWGAKEAAYKAVTKLRGSPPVFHHAGFRVRIPRPHSGSGPSSGTVRYRETDISFRVDSGADWIHVVGWVVRGSPDPPPPGKVPDGPPAGLFRDLVKLADPDSPGREEDAEVLRESFTSRERASIHGPLSALVRIYARSALARDLGCPEERLEIVTDPGPVGRTPPRVLLDGEAVKVDLTLSHHHRLLAWAYLLPRQG